MKAFLSFASCSSRRRLRQQVAQPLDLGRIALVGANAFRDRPVDDILQMPLMRNAVEIFALPDRRQALLDVGEADCRDLLRADRGIDVNLNESPSYRQL
jgi:hypothetical protein